MAATQDGDGPASTASVPDASSSWSRYDCAESVAGEVVNRILAEGGHTLWRKYLARKAFPFAVDAAMEMIMCKAQMCFVPCDQEEDMEEDWALEEEPQPAEKDSWVRMMLPRKDPVRTTSRSTRASYSASSTTSSIGGGRRRKTTKSLNIEGTIKEERKAGPRSWDITPKVRIDPEEERHREQKLLDRQKQKEKEIKDRQEKKAAEQERTRIEALHQEMEKRPHTFDLDGNVLWIQPPNPQKLPRFQEVVRHDFKADNEKAFRDSKTKLNETPPKPIKGRGKNRSMRKKKSEVAEEFPDSFTKLAHGQPPIMETMSMKPGVQLDHKGKQKAGGPPAAKDGQMTRSDYISLASREISGDTQFQFTATGGVKAVGGNSGQDPEDSTTSPASPTKSGSLDASGAFDATSGSAKPRSDSLPTLDPGRPSPAATDSPAHSQSPTKNGGLVMVGSGAGLSDAFAGGNRHGEVQTSPLAPPMHLRARKFESVGDLGRPPRSRMPTMGKLDPHSPFGKAPPPPVGATMGHGLLRTHSSVDEFYFPPFVPESPTAGHTAGTMLPRSRSEATLPTYDSRSGGSRSPENHGRMNVEHRSPAYRQVRKALFPRSPPPPGTAGGRSDLSVK